MTFIVGVDIGGTFTDCVAIREAPTDSHAARHEVRIGKAPSTPPDFQTGFLAAIRATAVQFELSPEDLLTQAQGIYHGCTVGTNALVEGRTAQVGLITTRGHRDSLFIMRAGGRLRHMPADYIAHVAAQTKPEPLIPRELCEEVDERVASDGKALVELNRDSARAAIERLINKGVKAFAISLLWSTANSSHEDAIRGLVDEMAPGSFVSVSSEVAPRVGEYERTVATVINSLIGPAMEIYLERLAVELKAGGYAGDVQVMTCSGGLVPANLARRFPVLTVGSGPVAGLIGAASLSRRSGAAHVVTGDVGGTTFDVGVVHGGQPLVRSTASFGQFEYFVPTVDVRSVGAGGGSMIRSDGKVLRVGPESAGARPGPACYPQGGDSATVTDANLVLGYLNPDYFLGGRIKLDRAAAAEALGRAGAPLGFDAMETAAAALRIIDNRMADAMRLMTIQQGHDIRNFVMYAYGGGGAVHATAIARILGMRQVLIPLSNFAAGWSAFGVASSEAVIARESVMGMASPFDPAALEARWGELQKRAEGQLLDQGLPPEKIRTERFAEMKYAMQVNQLEVKAAPRKCDRSGVDELIRNFEQEYERLFGAGSGYADAGYSLTSIGVRARASLTELKLEDVNIGARKGGAPLKVHREVVWYEAGLKSQRTPIYDGECLGRDDEVEGPAIIEYPDTTVVLRHGNRARVDALGCVTIDIV